MRRHERVASYEMAHIGIKKPGRLNWVGHPTIGNRKSHPTAEA
jgi:hypothetical protein